MSKIYTKQQLNIIIEEKTQSTCLTGGDVDSDLLFGGRAQIGHSVHRLYAEGVVGVGQHVRDQHFRDWETKLSRYEMDAVAAWAACFAIVGALPAVDVVGDVPSAATVSGRTPL